jgi:TatD family hydrolase
MLDAHFHPNYLPRERLGPLLLEARGRGVLGGLWAGVGLDDTREGLEWRHNTALCAANQLHFARRGEFTPAHLSTDSSTLFLSHGLHPWYLHRHWIREDGTLNDARMLHDMERFTRLLEENEDWIWAIGETGFDLAPGLLRSPEAARLGKDRLRELQARTFDFSLEMAERFGLPVIVHSRDHWRGTMERLERHAAGFGGRVMVHCYGGSAEELPALARLGAFASFGGVATWKKSVRTARAATLCPDEMFLLETDAPDLPPEYPDGRRPGQNSPAELAYICERIAQLRGCSTESLARLSDTNLFRFLGL